jgi:hypothetical protein
VRSRYLPPALSGFNLKGEMTMVMKGGCLCGAVRYEAADPVVTALCHCKHCQRISGSAYSVNVLFPEGSMHIEGATQYYLDTGDSGGHLQRHFCPKCGSSLYTKADAVPGIIILKAGTLDDTTSVKPTVQLYCARAQTWVPPVPGTQIHPLAIG